MSKKGNIQSKFRKQTFTVSQFWNINYTEVYENDTESDYKTFIKAKSYMEAKRILKQRLAEEEPPVKIKSVQGFMFHKAYKGLDKLRIGQKEWEQIRNASFPNVNNLIYKHNTPRDPEKSNRFNTTNIKHLKKIGFKKGHKNWNKGNLRPVKDQEGMIYSGKWIVWDKKAMDQTRQSLITALIKCDNNRSHACKSLGIGRSKFYKLLNRFPSIDWDKEYPIKRNPPPKLSTEARSALQKKTMKKRMAKGYVPFGSLTKEQNKKKYEKRKVVLKKKKEERLNKLIPQIKEALKSNENSRILAASQLKMKRSYLCRAMRESKHLVNWAVQFPCKYSRKKLSRER